MSFVTGVRTAVGVHRHVAATEWRTSIIMPVCITFTTGIVVSEVQPYATENFRANQTFSCTLVNCTWPKTYSNRLSFDWICPCHTIQIRYTPGAEASVSPETAFFAYVSIQFFYKNRPQNWPCSAVLRWAKNPSSTRLCSERCVVIYWKEYNATSVRPQGTAASKFFRWWGRSSSPVYAKSPPSSHLSEQACKSGLRCKKLNAHLCKREGL